MIINSVFYKIDKPIGRVEFLLYTILLFIIKSGIKFSYRFLFPYVNNKEVLVWSLNILFAIFVFGFIYLTYITVSKRFWSITQNKKIALITTAIVYIIALSSVFFYKPLLIIWYIFGLLMYILPSRKQEISAGEEDNAQ